MLDTIVCSEPLGVLSGLDTIILTLVIEFICSFVIDPTY
jgi:hypothetical protein